MTTQFQEDAQNILTQLSAISPMTSAGVLAVLETLIPNFKKNPPGLMFSFINGQADKAKRNQMKNHIFYTLL